MDPLETTLLVTYAIAFLVAGWLMGYAHGYAGAWTSALRAMGGPQSAPSTAPTRGRHDPHNPVAEALYALEVNRRDQLHQIEQPLRDPANGEDP